jgi:quercetin dioxygenase-like cupin family protein
MNKIADFPCSTTQEVTMKRRWFLAAIAMAGAQVLAQSPGSSGPIVLTPDDLKWQPGRLPGLENANVIGDSAKPGPYVQYVRFPGNYRTPPHSHPDDRQYTILSGTWYVGFGDTFDESRLTALPAGSFYTEPANAPHFVMTKEPATVQISGTGPTGVTPVAKQPR